MTTIADFFTISPAEVLRNELVGMIVARHMATPRHLQVELGPSEIGHPCTRHMAYALTNPEPVPRCNPQWDPLPSIIGVATHTWLQSAAELANAELHRDRWLAETKVHPAEWLSGSCDLFDCDTGTVIDWKVPGDNQFAILKAHMNPVYRAQAHLYGKGFANAGYDVKTVAIMMLPRGGTLAKAHLWSEPYDEKLADDTMSRRLLIAEQLKVFDIHNHPERYEWFKKDGYQCVFCPWFSPRPNGPMQCGGDDMDPPPGSYT
jgi:hypothetical protein